METGKTMVHLSFVLALMSVAPSASAEFGIWTSSNTRSMIEDLTTLGRIQPQPAPRGWETLSRFYDRGMPQAARTTPFPAAPVPFANSTRMNPAPLNMQFVSQPTAGTAQASVTRSQAPQADYGAPQNGLLKMSVGPLDTLYRLYQGTLFKSVQRAGPNASGQAFNRDGGFVGDWKIVDRPIFSRITDFDARSGSLYTVKKSIFGGGQSIYRDGKRLAPVGPYKEMRSDPMGNLHFLRGGTDSDRIYKMVQGATGASEKLLYTVPHKTTRHVHYNRVMNSRGGVTYVPYEEKHAGGITSFDIATNGQVYWVQAGTPYKATSDGKGQMILGQPVSERNPVIIFRDGNISHVRTGPYSELYAITDRGDVYLNGTKVLGASVGKEWPELKGASTVEVSSMNTGFIVFNDSTGVKRIMGKPMPCGGEVCIAGQ